MASAFRLSVAIPVYNEENGDVPLPAPRGLEVPEQHIKAIYVLFTLLLLYVVVRGVVGARGKPFWYDEVMTLAVSDQGSWKGIVHALRPPLDSHPPLFYAIENYALKFTQNEEIALRLPSILAFPCTLICVFVYIKRQAGEIVGFLCAMFLLMTDIFQYYAMEARGYSMVIACVAFAMVCYQRVPSPLWTALLALSFALAESLHYYAIFMMVPFGLAEVIPSFRTRRVQWTVWAALGFGAFPLVVFWPLLSALKACYGPHFWLRPQFSSLPQIYGDFLQTDRRIGCGIAAMIFVGVLGGLFGGREAKAVDKRDKNKVQAQIVLLLGFLLLPFIGYAVTTIMHSGLVPRYVLCTVLGISAGLGLLLSSARRRAVALFGIFVFTAVGLNEIHFWKLCRTDIVNLNSFGATREMLIESGGYKDLPVLVSEGLVIVPLAHYTTSLPVSKRLVFLTQDPQPNNKQYSDSIDKELQLFQSYSALRISTFAEFTAANSQFLFYVDEKYLHMPTGDWVALRLDQEGWSTHTVASGDSVRVCLVKRKRGSD